MNTTTLQEKLDQLAAISCLSDEEVLTVALGRMTGREDVLKELLAACGGLHGILNADAGELAQKIGKAKAAQLQAILEVARRLPISPYAKEHQIRGASDVIYLVREDMMYLDHEETRVLVLNTKHYVITNQVIYRGTLDSSVMRISEVFRPAIARKAMAIVVCHNHPSGDSTPSPEDIELTKRLVEAGDILDIGVQDHVIIGNPHCVSLREHMKW